MRKPIIAGNWKMNKTLSEAKSFVEEVKGLFQQKTKWILLFVLLHYFLESLVQIVKGYRCRNWCTKYAF